MKDRETIIEKTSLTFFDRDDLMKETERNLSILIPRTKSQKEFYNKWLKAWRIGKTLEIENEYGYLFDYMKQIIRRAKNERELGNVEAKILKLQLAYPANSVYRKSNSFHRWAYEYRADTQIARENYQEAIDILSGAFKFSVRINIDKLLSLKLFVGEDLNGWDLLNLRGWTGFTKWGKSNIPLVAESADNFLQKKRQELDSTILPLWRKEARKAGRVHALPKISIFHGMLPTNKMGELRRTAIFTTTVKEYPFRFISPFSLSDSELSKIIENSARTSQNLPLIGEGWISETDLYYTIKENFSDNKVLFHASPNWLGRQHLDVYIPELRIALEYQGEQHDRPVEFFGGEKAFIKAQERDARKLDLCNLNGVKLIYIRAGYSLREVLKLIKAR